MIGLLAHRTLSVCVPSIQMPRPHDAGRVYTILVARHGDAKTSVAQTGLGLLSLTNIGPTFVMVAPLAWRKTLAQDSSLHSQVSLSWHEVPNRAGSSPVASPTGFLH